MRPNFTGGEGEMRAEMFECDDLLSSTSVFQYHILLSLHTSNRLCTVQGLISKK